MPENNFPLVSVAIITYNQKEFLRACLDSVLAQDYPNLEVIIADDASDDGTHDMLYEYETRYPGKIILKLAEINQGITYNSNVAHFACSGKYVAWMGGDDLMLPGKLRKQVEFMESDPDCTICYHDLDVFDSLTNRTLYRFSEKNTPKEGDVKVAVKYGCFNGACSTMVRRDRTPKKGYNRELPVASDWLYWVEALSSGGNIRYIDEILGRYRRHAGNVTNKRMVVGRNTVDHLNSCNLVLAKNPEYFKELSYCYSMIIRGERHVLQYGASLWFVFKVTGDLKSFFCLCVYLLSFGVVKI
ncbi:glycosyltransferase [uncultured Marinobacter sp.]|uniref:glycosyltransferase n=1 Tax=uncultured Marinobacter sp. TaxID=187379 RepID=UPI0026387E1B|nr:glycosyltransferase [uncultured Marinobacter sp.]